MKEVRKDQRNPSVAGRIYVFSFEGTSYSKAQWLSWLERRPVTAEVVGSSPIWVAAIIMGS